MGMEVAKKKLEKLSAQQLARLPEIRDEWLRIGLSTEPLNFDEAKKAVIAAYEIAGMQPPKLFFRFQSPISAAIGAAMLKGIDLTGDQVWDQVWGQVRGQVRDQVWDQVWDQVRDQVRDQVWDQVGGQVRDQVWDQVGGQVRDQVWDQVGDQVRDQVWDQVGGQVYGCHDANWLGFYAAFAEFGISDAEKLIPLMNLAKHCGWWAPYSGAAIVQDRPTVLKFDDQKRLHCEDGPAIRYPDGLLEVYSWHGTRILKEWIEDKNSLTPKMALSESNVERRRAACEIIGWAKILEQLNAKTIDRNPDELIGELLEVNLPDSGKEKFLRVRCGTGRSFAIPVPPDMKTAHQANAWTWGLTADQYHPEVRT